MVISEEPVTLAEAAELLDRARQGDAEAFCQLIATCQTRLFREALGLCGNETDAEELVSETLVEAWRSIRVFRAECRLSTWLYAILLHRHQKLIRARRSRPISLAGLPGAIAQEQTASLLSLPDERPSPADAAAVGEQAVEMNRWIGQLPEKHQQVLRLRFFDDASLPEMASALGCPLGTVKSRLHHALEKLRQLRMNLLESRRDK